MWLVAFEVRKEKVSVRYVRDEEEGWTPVVWRKRKKVLDVWVMVN